MPLPWEECRSWQELLDTFKPSYPHIPSYIIFLTPHYTPRYTSLSLNPQSPIHITVTTTHTHNPHSLALSPPASHTDHHTVPPSTSSPQVPSSTSRPPPFPSLIRPAPPRWHHNSQHQPTQSSPTDPPAAHYSLYLAPLLVKSQVSQRTKRSPDFTEEPPAILLQRSRADAWHNTNKAVVCSFHKQHLRLSAFCVCLLFCFAAAFYG